MAQFIGEIQKPEEPESIAQWSREVASLLNGQISIGEPVSEDTTRLPNGVKGHLVGSFVSVVLNSTVGSRLNVDAITCTHNLDVPNKGTGTGPTEINVGWFPVRWEHDGNTSDAASVVTAVFQSGDTITDNSIELRFNAAGTRVVDNTHPLYVTLWFFPTTR